MTKQLPRSLTEKMLQVVHAQFDQPNVVWGAWEYTTRKERVIRTTGHLWWKKEILSYSFEPIQGERKPYPMEWIDGKLEIDIRQEFVADWTGIMHGIRFYKSETSDDYILFVPFQANTNRITAGSTITIDQKARLEIK